MDSLLFLIKKHNNNKTVGYNDKLAYITFINKNEYDEVWHKTHHMLYYIGYRLINYGMLTKHWGIK